MHFIVYTILFNFAGLFIVLLVEIFDKNLLLFETINIIPIVNNFGNHVEFQPSFYNFEKK